MKTVFGSRNKKHRVKRYGTLIPVIAAAALLSLVRPVIGEKHAVLSEDGVTIVYETIGRGEPTLVFVHCWCCDRAYWKHQVPFFARQYRVVTIDLAGHGESGLERDDWTVQAFARDVAAVVKDLDLERTILIGHSMGGSVVLETSRLIPSRVIGIVGVDTYQNFESDITEEQQKQFLAPFKADFETMTAGFVRSMFPADADSALVDRIAADMSSAPPEVGVGAMENYLQYRPAETLGELVVPIHGINSDKFPVNVEGNRRVAKSYSVTLMHGLGHFVQLEDPEEFNRYLQAVITKIETGGSME
jgi:pimeloyl-ACP methyl ester carboxylesterase